MMNYIEWNNKLAAHFFRAANAGRQVFLFVTDDLLDELGGFTGDSCRTFVSVVKAGHPWLPDPSLDVCRKALHCYNTWRTRSAEYPSYIAYLSLFVLAAGREEDCAPHAYYPRLWALLGEPGTGMPPGFDRMELLWQDLEHWASDEQRGDLGFFTFRRVGGWVNVGIPLAQTILTEAERRLLPSLFAAAQLDATAAPSDSVLRRALRVHGAHLLRPRSLALVSNASASDQQLLDVLLTTVRDELGDWDGHVTPLDPDEEPSVFGSLRLCAILDRVAGTCSVVFRCALNSPFPESGLLLTRPNSEVRFRCEGEFLYWSAPLIDEASHAFVDASQFQWDAGLELRDERFAWRFRLPSGPIRILRPGQSEGLPGLVEVSQLSPSVPFYLLARHDACATIEAWGHLHCEHFSKVLVSRGLPAGWHLYAADAARSDELIREAYPALAFPRSVRLLLHFGVSAGRAGDYLYFGLPIMEIEGGAGDETLWCNGAPLHAEDGLYCLPVSAAADGAIALEVRHSPQEIIRRKTIGCVTDFDWQSHEPLALNDPFGLLVVPPLPGATGVAGALSQNIDEGEAFYSPPVSCFQDHRVFFVGSVAGQILSWPTEDLSASWSPTWAIPMARRGRVIFCGRDLQAPRINATTSMPGDTSNVTLWKDVLYHWRKRIAPPRAAHLRRLWQQYVEVARNVRA